MDAVEVDHEVVIAAEEAETLIEDRHDVIQDRRRTSSQLWSKKVAADM